MQNSFIAVGSGGFRIHPKPRGGEWLESDLQTFRADGIQILVSLLTASETEELRLAQESQLCAEVGLEFMSFPIPDRQVPAFRESFQEFVESLASRLTAGQYAVFHCRAGLGRAPLLGCAVLVHTGTPPIQAWELIAQWRGQDVPDTEEQRNWISDGGGMTFEDALTISMSNGDYGEMQGLE